MSTTAKAQRTHRIENLFLAALLVVGGLGAYLAFGQKSDEAAFRKFSTEEPVAVYEQARPAQQASAGM